MEIQNVLEQNKSKLERTVNTESGIVVPAILWWLGVPITILILLWLFGVF